MKTLAIDIETSPNICYTWGLHDQNIGLNQILQTSAMICFAARFLGERKMHFYADWTVGHEAMVDAAHGLLDEADVLLHYNGKQFDVPHLTREFQESITWATDPPAPFRQIDLYQTMKRSYFQSRKLQHVAEKLGAGSKVEHNGMPLWHGAINGDPSAQRKMGVYCRQDVRLLEVLHELILPWIPSYPNVALIDGKPGACPRCGAVGRMQRRGTRYTRVSAFQQYQCQACGGWSQDTRRSDHVTRAEAPLT